MPVLARVAASLESDGPALDGRLVQHASRKTPVWLVLTAPPRVEAAERWRALLQGVLSRHGGQVAIVEVDVGESDPKLAAYLLRLAATEVRAERETIRVAIGGPAASRAYSAELAPYLDLLVLGRGQDVAAAETRLRQIDPGAQLAIVGNRAAAVTDLVDSELQTLGTDVVLHAWSPSDALAPALRSLAPLATLMAGDVSGLDGAVARLTLARGNRDVTGSVRHRLLFDDRTFATYLAYWGDPSPEPLQLSLTLPVEGAPAVYRLSDGATLQVADYSRVAETGLTRASVPVPGGPMLVNFSEGAGEAFVQRSEVSAARPLSVDEIIARHQQQQRAQDGWCAATSRTARMEQHFRPTMTDPGYDVASENRYFVSGAEVEWEELSFSVNGTKWGPDRPAFPLLQAEKVLSLPLQLRFDSDYRYRLAGTERVGDYDCYVVRFDPVGTGQSLYRGTVWIERRTFARVKVQAVQTSLAAPVVSNEEIQTYAPVASIGNRPVFLFTRLDRAPDHADRRPQPARREDASCSGTSRSTRRISRGHGPRRGAATASCTGRPIAGCATTSRRERRGSSATARPAAPARWRWASRWIRRMPFRCRSSASTISISSSAGPTRSWPFSFAGVLAAGNLQRPKIGSTPLDASVDFFAIAVPSSDRVYDAAGEHETERLLTWPLTTGVNLGWQYTPFQKVSGSYQFRFDGYSRDTTTSETYRRAREHDHQRLRRRLGIPARRLQRGGQRRLVRPHRVAGMGRRRMRRRPVPRRAYLKYSASLSRDFYFNVFHKVHLNGAWFGGRDLDRFVKYQFGHVRRHPHPWRPRLGRSLRGARDGARLVLVQHLRAVPARPVPRAGVGP